MNNEQNAKFLELVYDKPTISMKPESNLNEQIIYYELDDKTYRDIDIGTMTYISQQIWPKNLEFFIEIKDSTKKTVHLIFLSLDK